MRAPRLFAETLLQPNPRACNGLVADALRIFDEFVQVDQGQFSFHELAQVDQGQFSSLLRHSCDLSFAPATESLLTRRGSYTS